MNNGNPFGQLDAQSECSSFAQMSPAEHESYQQWIDDVNALPIGAQLLTIETLAPVAFNVPIQQKA